MKTALVFPGQGSQAVGMGKALIAANAEARALVERADAVLGYGLSAIMFEGPEESLGQTQFTQPALYVHSLAAFAAHPMAFDSVAGHSLGEFSALAAAGVFSFEDGLRIVAKRGSLMQAAGTTAPGAMAAIIGMADDVVEKACADATAATGGQVVPANYNSPGQLVISGSATAVDKAIELLIAQGCKIAKKLNVSGAFHSPLMKPAYEEFKAFIAGFSFATPAVPVYQNVTAAGETDPDVIRHNVIAQLVSPVRWTQTLQRMKGDGTGAFVEVGSGKVLQGLIKRTLTDVTISGVQ